MSKPRAIRNRKSEMISCWVCAAFIAILFIGKNLLIGSGSMAYLTLHLLFYLSYGFLISLFYTIQYFKWKKANNM